MVSLGLHRQYVQKSDATEKCLGFEIEEVVMGGCGVPHVIEESEHVGQGHSLRSHIYH